MPLERLIGAGSTVAQSHRLCLFAVLVWCGGFGQLWGQAEISLAIPPQRRAPGLSAGYRTQQPPPHRRSVQTAGGLSGLAGAGIGHG